MHVPEEKKSNQTFLSLLSTRVNYIIHNMGLHNTCTYHVSLGSNGSQKTKGAPKETAN